MASHVGRVANSWKRKLFSEDDNNSPGNPKKKGKFVLKSKLRKEQRKQKRHQKGEPPAQGSKKKTFSGHHNRSDNSERPPFRGSSSPHNGKRDFKQGAAFAHQGGKKKKLTEGRLVAARNEPESNFMKLLKEQGLVSSSSSSSTLKEDEDTKTIKRMEKLLGIKQGKFDKELAGTGLDFVLAFKDDLTEGQKMSINSKKKSKASAEPSGDEEENPDDLSDLDAFDGEDGFDDDDFGLGMDDPSSEDEAPEQFDDNEDFGLTPNPLIKNKKQTRKMSDEEEEEEKEDYDDDDDDDDDDEGEDEDEGDDDEDENEYSEDDREEEGGEGSEDDQDGETLSKKKKQVSFITRWDAYGENAVPSIPESMRPKSNSDEKAAVGKYVPPSRRGEVDFDEKLKRSCKGLMNKLNDSNMSVIIDELVTLFQGSSRIAVKELVTGFILDACMDKDRVLGHLLVVYVGCIATLYGVLGEEIGAFFLQKLASQFSQTYAEYGSMKVSTEDPEIVGKQGANMAVVFALLYHFKLVSDGFVFELLKLFAEKFSTVDVELILAVLKTCGAKLRRDNAVDLKAFLDLVSAKASSSSQSPRIRVMTELILDIRHNRKRLAADTPSQLDAVMAAMRATLTKHNAKGARDPFRITYAELLQSHDRGRWWVVGSSWVGRDGGKSSAAQSSTPTSSSDQMSEKLLKLAAANKMNTETRRRIFCTLMGAEDYVDGYEKLMRLNLKGKEDREIVKVLMKCAVKEKVYNPFYSYVADKMCEFSNTHKTTFQYTVWDYFKQLGTMNSKEINNLARIIDFLISKSHLSIGLFKVVDFGDVNAANALLYQLTFALLLTHHTEEVVKEMFGRVAGAKDLAPLRASMKLFMIHFLSDFELGLGNGGGRKELTEDEKKELLRARVRMVRRLLDRGMVDVDFS